MVAHLPCYRYSSFFEVASLEGYFYYQLTSSTKMALREVVEMVAHLYQLVSSSMRV